MTASRLFGQDARERIAQAVRSAESRTSGQIVPVVVDRSLHYPEAPLRAALLGAALASAILFWIPDLGGALSLLVAGGAALLAVALALAWPGLQRLLIGARTLDESVQHRAVRAFVEHGVNLTKGETGVLIFASLFEHRVVVLGDRAIHEKMGEAGWQQAVSALTSGLRSRAAEDGFIAAVQIVGAKLSAAFPRVGPSPGNELPDELRVDKV